MAMPGKTWHHEHRLLLAALGCHRADFDLARYFLLSMLKWLNLAILYRCGTWSKLCACYHVSYGCTADHVLFSSRMEGVFSDMLLEGYRPDMARWLPSEAKETSIWSNGNSGFDPK